MLTERIVSSDVFQGWRRKLEFDLAEVEMPGDVESLIEELSQESVVKRGGGGFLEEENHEVAGDP